MGMNTDRLEVLNGPEDGAEFPLVRTPSHVGSSADCAVYIRLDPNIEPLHAVITGVSGGYRLRRAHGGVLLVSGKRVGRLRSCIARNGDVVQVGDTQLYLECIPGGLASRSQGMPLESDLGYAVRVVARRLRGMLRRLGRSLRGALGLLSKSLLVILILLAVLFYWREDLIGWGIALLRQALEWFWSFYGRLAEWVARVQT